MTWLSESLQTIKPASSLFQAWLEKPGSDPCLRQYPWQHYRHLVTARIKVCLPWGAWKVIFDEGFDRWRPVFLGNVWEHRGWPKGFTPPPPLLSPPTAWWTPMHLWRNPWHNPQTAGHKAAAAWWPILPCKGAGRSVVVKPAPNPPGALRLQGKTLLTV